MKKLTPIRWMRCTCCGGSFKGRQFNNQDIGWGLGDCCVEYVKVHFTTLGEDFERTYGTEGIHFKIFEQNS